VGLEGCPLIFFKSWDHFLFRGEKKISPFLYPSPLKGWFKLLEKFSQTSWGGAPINSGLGIPGLKSQNLGLTHKKGAFLKKILPNLGGANKTGEGYKIFS